MQAHALALARPALVAAAALALARTNSGFGAKCRPAGCCCADARPRQQLAASRANAHKWLSESRDFRFHKQCFQAKRGRAQRGRVCRRACSPAPRRTARERVRPRSNRHASANARGCVPQACTRHGCGRGDPAQIATPAYQGRCAQPGQNHPARHRARFAAGGSSRESKRAANADFVCAFGENQTAKPASPKQRQRAIQTKAKSGQTASMVSSSEDFVTGLVGGFAVLALVAGAGKANKALLRKRHHCGSMAKAPTNKPAAKTASTKRTN